MVGLPLGVYEQLEQLHREMTASREKGRGYQDIRFVEQGMGRIPFGAVIERLIKDFQDHRKRSGLRRKI